MKVIPLGAVLLLLAAASFAAAPAKRDALPFVQDDYPRALREARAKNRPIFIENWAPW